MYLKPSIAKILDDLERLLAIKQEQYGETFEVMMDEYKEFPVIMLEMKLLRLKRQYKKDPYCCLDTLMDIAGYAVLTLTRLYEKENLEEEI